jgi:hypothetical protein
MMAERLSKGRRGALIEKHLHSSWCEGAAGGMLKYGTGLLGGDTRKPLDELVQRGIIFQVLEEG